MEPPTRPLTNPQTKGWKVNMRIPDKDNLVLYGLLILAVSIFIFLMVKSTLQYDLYNEMEKRDIQTIQCDRDGKDLKCLTLAKNGDITFNYMIDSPKYKGEDQIVFSMDSPPAILGNHPGAYADIKKLIWAYDATGGNRKHIED